jgi:membrane fusion protein (multidrug efflux system)
MRVHLRLRAALLAANILTAPYAMAQSAPSAPPAFGVVTVERRPMTDVYDFNARIEPMNGVNIVARVTAFVENQLVVNGSEVKKGDLPYSLEKPPFLAAVNVHKAAVARAEAELENDALDFRRAQQLAQVKAGSQQVH